MKGLSRLNKISTLLGVAVATASSLGIFVGATYSREAVSYAAQGIGQDWVNLLVATPLLWVCAYKVRQGSRKALFVLGGPILYALYSYILYAFTLHFNELFLLYCATLGLAFFGFLEWWNAMKCEVRRIKLPNEVFSKGAAGFQITIAVLFLILWLSEIIPAQINGTIPKSIADSGLITNGVYVLDLSILLPALVVSAVLLVKKRTNSVVLSTALLGFSAIMTLAIFSMMVTMKVFNLEFDVTVAVVMLALTVAAFYFAQKFVSVACKFPKVVLLVGIPGSGKSTYAKSRFANEAHRVHSTDAIREELFGDENIQGEWKKIEGVLKVRVAESVKNGVIAIVDATHASKEHRVNAIEWINRLGAEVHAFYVNTPLEVCKERNKKRQRVVPDYVLEGMHAALAKNPPSIEDGFERIETVDAASQIQTSRP